MMIMILAGMMEMLGRLGPSGLARGCLGFRGQGLVVQLSCSFGYMV